MKIRTQVLTCLACPFPSRPEYACTSCGAPLCMACSRRAMGLCPICDAEYVADTLERYEAEEEMRFAALDRLERG